MSLTTEQTEPKPALSMENSPIKEVPVNTTAQGGSIEALPLWKRFLQAEMLMVLALGNITYPKSCQNIMRFTARSGDGWIWVPVYMLVTLFNLVPSNLLFVGHCLFSLAISLTIYTLLKHSIQRPRPFELMMDCSPQVPPLDKWSFPSGHTMNNMAVGLTVASYWEGFFPVAATVPLIIGTLRVILGVHYPTDIVFGGLFGIFCFKLSEWLFPLLML